MIKILAFHLPQFHTIPENDQWWGEGFTEWTNVKKAIPLYKGHIQPRCPLNDKYYNLLEKETMIWQNRLAQEYGIDGFCYFQYWFKGKKVLERPLENLLKWKEINQRFCLCWANNTWKRTWKKGAGTTWCIEDTKRNEEPGILLKQEYGQYVDWVKHYEYLRDFFKDVRYIKVDNKPMYLIYQISEIGCLNEMLECWNDLAINDGFAGIHVVSMNDYNFQSKYVEAVVQYEPGNINQKRPILKYLIRSKINYILGEYGCQFRFLNKYDYDTVWKRVLKEKPSKNIKTYTGAFVGYDSTPRQGRFAIIYKNSTPDKFEKYLTLQLKRTIKLYKSEFMFINAWNEWAEGNYLEPDKVNGYKYLEALKRARLRSKTN